MYEEFEPWPTKTGLPGPQQEYIIGTANLICAELKEQGYDLTLRQLYYQFVARGLLENTERNYKNLGVTLSKARMAGLMDWSYLEDRTRSLQGYNISADTSEFVSEQQKRMHFDHWLEQRYRVEVWVEKEALASVVARAALAYGVDYFACRGNVSMSEMYAASKRHLAYEDEGQQVIVLHLGDHDPNGIDMTRDNQDRLALMGTETEVRRIALNMDQIRQYNPPPNPAKTTDSRSKRYIQRYGNESWELDSLQPSVINELITSEIVGLMSNTDAYNESVEHEKAERSVLGQVADQWDAVREFVTA